MSKSGGTLYIGVPNSKFWGDASLPVPPPRFTPLNWGRITTYCSKFRVTAIGTFRFIVYIAAVKHCWTNQPTPPAQDAERHLIHRSTGWITPGTVQAKMEIFGTTEQLPLSTLTAIRPPTCSPLSPSITHSLFHSRLKTQIFSTIVWTAFWDYTGPDLLCSTVFHKFS